MYSFIGQRVHINEVSELVVVNLMVRVKHLEVYEYVI